MKKLNPITIISYYKLFITYILYSKDRKKSKAYYSGILILLASTVVSPLFVNGQTRNDVVFFNYSYAPPTNFQNITGKSNLYKNIEIQLGIPPIKLINNLTVINTFYGRSLNYDFKNLPDPLLKIQKKLTDIRYSPLLTYKVNSKWSVMALPTVMLRSDLQHKLSGKDLFYNGLIVANFNPDEEKKVIFSFGVILTNDLTHNQINPVAGFTYKSKKLLAEVGYPRTNIFFKPKSKIEWGVTVAVDGATFKVNEIQLTDTLTAKYIRSIDVFAGQALNFNLFGKVWLNTQIGCAFLRRYDLMNSDYKKITIAKTELNGSFYAKAGISLRIGNL